MHECKFNPFCVVHRYHGWIKPFWWSAWRSEVHSHRHHTGHHHNLHHLYPSCVNMHRAPPAGHSLTKQIKKMISSSYLEWNLMSHSITNTESICQRWCNVSCFFLWPECSDMSSVVLFGACIEGAVLRDKYVFMVCYLSWNVFVWMRGW